MLHASRQVVLEAADQDYTEVYQHHLGGNYYAISNPKEGTVTLKKLINEQCVQSHTTSMSDEVKRSNFDPDHFENIVLTREEIKMITENFNNVTQVAPYLKTMVPCYTFHGNQTDYFSCPECCPNGRYT